MTWRNFLVFIISGPDGNWLFKRYVELWLRYFRQDFRKRLALYQWTIFRRQHLNYCLGWTEVLVANEVTWQTLFPRHGIHWGLVLWRFILRWFTFTTLAETDWALPTCGASLSQLKCPFSTQCTPSSFPVCMCFFFFYFSAVLLSWLWFFYHWHPSRRQIILFSKKEWKEQGRP